MPRPEINDYVFYKIVNDDLPEYVYIGSTGCFYKRKWLHKCVCNNPNNKNHNLKLYKTIRDNGGWDRWNMKVIDEAKQLTLTEARIKEEMLRKEYNGNLNTVKAYQTVEERKEYEKDYLKINKEVILEKHKEYRDSHKESILEKKKVFRESNKELLCKKQKEYYVLNKKVINGKNKEKITCECGSVFTLPNKSRHKKSLKHQQFCQPIDLSIT